MKIVQFAQFDTRRECFNSLRERDRSSRKRSSGTFCSAKKA